MHRWNVIRRLSPVVSVVFLNSIVFAQGNDCPDQYIAGGPGSYVYSLCDCDGPSCISIPEAAVFVDLPATGCDENGECNNNSTAVVIQFVPGKLGNDGKPVEYHVKWKNKPFYMKKAVDLDVPINDSYIDENYQVVRATYGEHSYSHFNDVEGKSIGYKDYRGILKANVDGSPKYFLALRKNIEKYPVKIEKKRHVISLRLFYAMELKEAPNEKANFKIIEAEYKENTLTIIDENCQQKGTKFLAWMVKE